MPDTVQAKVKPALTPDTTVNWTTTLSSKVPGLIVAVKFWVVPTVGAAEVGEMAVTTVPCWAAAPPAATSGTRAPASKTNAARGARRRVPRVDQGDDLP